MPDGHMSGQHPTSPPQVSSSSSSSSPIGGDEKACSKVWSRCTNQRRSFVTQKEHEGKASIGYHCVHIQGMILLTKLLIAVCEITFQTCTDILSGHCES